MSYREGPGLDETEVAKFRIHEVEETKRRTVQEREETRRRSIAAMDTAGYVVPRIAAAVVGIALCIAGYNVVEVYLEHKYPAAIPECVETIKVITDSDSRKECKGGYIETQPIPGGSVIFKCKCARNDYVRLASPDGGQ